MARPKKIKEKEFLYSRQIRCLRERSKAPLIFDERQELGDSRAYKLTGTIGGFPAQLSYSDDNRYYIAAQKPEHLSSVYNLALDRLLGVDNSNGSSLAEIMGITTS